MKKCNYRNPKSVFIFAFILIFCAGCCKCPPTKNNYRDSEFTFVLAPGQNPEVFCSSLRTMFPDNDSITCTACACDSLVLVTGLKNVSITGQGGEAVAKSQVKPQGGELPQIVSYGRNYLLEMPPADEKNNFKRDTIYFGKENLTIKESPVDLLVGVMDSGLQLDLIPSSNIFSETEAEADICYPGAKNGWNFLSNSTNIIDDHPSRHGTFVTKLILNQGLGSKVRILPLKVLDSSNNGDLFHMLCAISFAEKKNVNIINASLGYYGQEDAVFKRYLDLLKKKNILVITSAGNKSEEADEGETGDPRNLGTRKNKFYPACYNNEYSNIISVTTSDKQPFVSVYQNYSSDYVNIAVIPKAPNDNSPKPLFEIPFSDRTGNKSIELEGSSFATPVVTGRIVKTIIDTSMPPPYLKKTFLYPGKRLNGLTSSAVVPFKPEVEYGYVIKE